MKRIFLLMTMLTFANSFANDLRTMPLQLKTFNGCYMENGIIKLHKALPSQIKDENLVLESENAMSIFFQEDVFARKSGAKVDELIQIKQSAKDYKPQYDDPQAKDGYIDYCKLANYQFNIHTPNEYVFWFRAWVPIVANWGFALNVNGEIEDVNLAKYIPGAKQWFWVKGPTKYLADGNHQVSIANFMHGKRLDQILLTSDKNFVPKGIEKSTALKEISSGEIIFSQANPTGLKSWDKISFSNINKTGKVEFFVSKGDSNKFEILNNDNLSSYKNTPLTIKCKLSEIDNQRPELSDLLLSYYFDKNSFFIIKNENTELYFSKKTGALSGIKNLKTNTEIQTIGSINNMFELLLKTPNKNDRRFLSQKDAKLIDFKYSQNEDLYLLWEFKKDKIKVAFDIKSMEDKISWEVTVINNNDSIDVIEVEAPKLSELKVSKNAKDDILIWPFSAGEFIDFPASKGEFSVAYPDHAGLGFVDLGNENEGLYFATVDPLLVATHFISKANYAQTAIELTMNRKHRIKAKSQLTYYFDLAVHNGNWHEGAKLYRKYFYSKYPKNTYRPWLRNIDAWHQGANTGYSGLMKQNMSYNDVIADFKVASFLSLPYIQMWGNTFNGACPSYYLPRKERGGEKLFAETMKQWRDAGGYIGHYYFANGISPYYLLTEKYFNTPWSEYPKEYQPPTFEWYVKNREYIGDNHTIDKDDLMKKTLELNKVHEENKVVRGNYEEILTGYMPMNWRNGEYANFLLKWIDIYINKYNCNTVYLDTFAFRNDFGDFNPYLKLNGEGDKPMFKMQFMNEMFKKMQAKEPDFTALTEGVADVFGTKLYFLLSGFARNPNIYRYTLPDQIFFQGGSNGLWTKPLMEKSIHQAFLVGNRFDLPVRFASTYYMLKLRQQISPFLNLAVFDDVNNIKVSNPKIECYAHITDENSNAIIENNGSKAITLTIGNLDELQGKITYKLPKDFNLKRAYVASLYRDIDKLEYKKDGQYITFDAPLAKASAVILVDELKGANTWSAMVQQIEDNKIKVSIYNFLDEKETFKVKALGKEQSINIAGSSQGSLYFERSENSKEFEMINVSISSKNYSSNRIISIGENQMKIPIPELSKGNLKNKKILNFDFEEISYSDKSPYSGKRALEIEGNGKYKMYKMPLQLEPNTAYLIEFAIKKGKDVSKKSTDNFVLIGNYTKDKKLVRYGTFAGNIVANDQYHRFKAEFITDDTVFNSAMFIYNHNTKDSLFIDDLVITKYANMKKIEPKVKKEIVNVPQKPKEKSVILYENFEDKKFYNDDAFMGKGCLKITGEGLDKFKMHKFPLELKPNTKYKITFSIKKGFGVSKVHHHNMGCVVNYTKGRKLNRYFISSKVANDGKWHTISGEFLTDDNLYSCGLYFYNTNSQEDIFIDEIKIEPVL